MMMRDRKLQQGRLSQDWNLEHPEMESGPEFDGFALLSEVNPHFTIPILLYGVHVKNPKLKVRSVDLGSISFPKVSDFHTLNGPA